jgi:ABC-type multidrug transport system ATPase subunit
MAGERCAVVIEAKGLSKRYGSKVAVDDLSFDVRPAA